MVRMSAGAAAVLVIVALIVAVLVVAFSAKGHNEQIFTPTSPGSAEPAVDFANGMSTGSPVSPSQILVHVLGAVKHPGLYQLHRNDRVVDAITAAGGFTPTANQAANNLARVMNDGEQLIVLTLEESASAPLAGVLPGGSGTGWSVTFTEDGGFYFDNGDYPAEPEQAATTSSATHIKAAAFVQGDAGTRSLVCPRRHAWGRRTR